MAYLIIFTVWLSFHFCKEMLIVMTQSKRPFAAFIGTVGRYIGWTFLIYKIVITF